MAPPQWHVAVDVVGMNTWYGERGPGGFSIILGSVCMDYFLLEPHYTLHVARSDIAYVITTRNIDPDQVQVTVEDSGMGIDPNAIGRSSNRSTPQNPPAWAWDLP